MNIPKTTVKIKEIDTAKLTITSDNSIRIKLSNNLNKKEINHYTLLLNEVAAAVIDKGYNIKTLRGHINYENASDITLKFESKNSEATVKVDLNTFKVYSSFKPNKLSSCVLIENNGLFLSVSRKDNIDDVGLPGGKLDKNLDSTPAKTATRECLEETGYYVNVRTDIKPFVKDNCYTWVAELCEERERKIISSQETGVVAFVDKNKLENESSFGDYNKEMFKHFINIGAIKNV